MRLTILTCAIVGATAIGAVGQDKQATRVANRPGSATAGERHALQPAIGLARSCQKTLAGVKDYQAAFAKKEVVGSKQIAQVMDIKLREQPFSVYLLFKGENQGREVIYNAGRNDDKLQVHDTGIKSLIGTISLRPDDPRVMAENRYPISLIGMSNLLNKVVQQWQSDMRYPDVDVKYYPNARLGNTACKVVQTSHSGQHAGVTFAMTRLYVDKNTNLPIRLEQYGFATQPGQQPPLLEEYTYTNVRVNTGLSDADFDVRNPAYDF